MSIVLYLDSCNNNKFGVGLHMHSHTVTLELPDPIYQVFAARSRITKRPLEEEIITAFAVDAPPLLFAETAGLAAYDEFLEFLASGPSPSDILQFQLSEKVRQRANLLVEKNRSQSLTNDEIQELDFYVELGDFLGILCAKTQLQMQS